MDSDATVACPGCGLRTPPIQGPTHPHMRCTPGCWATFGEVLAREFGDPAWFSLHQMTVDAYGASHPGDPGDRRAVQAIALHLMTLQLFCVEGVDVRAGPTLHKRMMQRPPDWHWLDPPPPRLGDTIAADVLAACTAEQHLRLVRHWGDDVWAAWSEHHATIHRWVHHSLL